MNIYTELCNGKDVDGFFCCAEAFQFAVVTPVYFCFYFPSPLKPQWRRCEFMNNHCEVC